MNTPGGNTTSAAELTLSLILALARNIPAAVASVKVGRGRLTGQGAVEGDARCGENARRGVWPSPILPPPQHLRPLPPHPPPHHDNMQAGRWERSKFMGSELSGKARTPLSSLP